MANLLSTIISGRLSIGSSSTTPYLTEALDGIVFGGNEVGYAYRLYTQKENYGGDYTKLNIAWHTGIKIGAYYGYGGIRFYDNSPSLGTEVFSVARGDSHVRVENNLYVGNTIYNNGNAVIHAGNIGSQSVDFATRAEFQTIPDYRGNAFTPNEYSGNRVWWHFNNKDAVGGYGTYWTAIQTVSPWSSYDASHRQQQIQWGGTDISFRYATSGTTWSDWFRFITDANIGAQSVSSSATTLQRDFSGDVSTSGQGRFAGWYTGNAQTGVAAEIGMSGGQGYVFVYNRQASTYGTLNIAASQANLQISGSTINATAGTLQQGGNNVIHAGDIADQSVNYATTAGSAPNASNLNASYGVTAGAGNGLKFWGGDDNYKISMGVGGLYQYGPVTDYSIKTQMDPGSTGRGFTWGTNGVAPVAALNGTSGNFQVAGTIANGSIWINNGANYNNYNENIRLFDAPNGVSVIAFSASGTEGSPRTSLLGYSDRLETRVSDTWEQRIYGGYVEARGSFRAPIFYDSEDTGYFLDPNSTSNLIQLTTSTRARWNMPRVWYDRSSRSSDQGYWTGTNGWGTSDGTWASAWQGGFSGWDIWGTNTDHPQGGNVHAQGIVSGQHYATSNIGYGWMMVGAHAATENRYWLRGKWDTTTSGWVEMITTGNIGSQSVSYAASAGVVGTADYAVTAGALTSMDISQFSNNSGYITSVGNITKLWAESHPTDYYVRANWTGSYWQLTSNHPSPVQVGYADNSAALSGLGVGSFLRDDGWNNYPGQDANTQEQMRVDFTYSNNAPYTGELVRFGSSGYSTQFNTSYGNSDNFAFRTRNGDNGTWNPWKAVIHAGNIGSQSVSYAASAGYADSIYWNGEQRLYGGSDGTRNTGWAYHNDNLTGLHWPNNGWHFYPKDVNDMYMRSGSGTNVAIAMSTAGTTRGYVYAENDNTIGFLNNSRSWSFRSYANGDATVYGYLTVNGGGAYSSIYMNDSDEGQREIHCNSNRIGFLTQAGAWGSYCNDDGSWTSVGNISGNYLYSNSSVRVGEVWGYGGLYRGEGSMIFGVEGDSGWSFRAGNEEKVWIANDGNIYMAWAGAYISTLLDAKQNANTAINTGNIANQSVSYASSSNTAAYLPTLYAGGQQGNPQVYFGQSVGLRVAMTGIPFYWADTLWINGYAGGDVLNMCALHFARSGQPRMWISTQLSTGTSYGTTYELWSSYNMDAPNKSGTSYYQTNTWMQFNGAYGLYWPSNYGAHFQANDASSYTQFRIQGQKNGWSGIYDDNSRVNGFMYDGEGNGGVYREANGLWYFYYHLGNNCMGIGTSTTSSSYKLYVNGTIYATGDVIAYSDSRKKTNIVTIDNALNKVLSMRGVFYNKVDEPQNGRQVGVIAQEVNEVLPEAVNYASDVDEYGVKYGNIVGVLIEAIKEQQAQIDELKAKLDGLTK